MDKVKKHTADIVRRVWHRSPELSQRTIKTVFNSCIDEIKQILIEGHKMTITGFLTMFLEEQVMDSPNVPKMLVGTHTRSVVHLSKKYKEFIKKNKKDIHKAILARKEAIKNDPLTKEHIKHLKDIYV